jgi:hypothetical protein
MQKHRLRDQRASSKQHTDIIGEDFMTFLGENATEFL